MNFSLVGQCAPEAMVIWISLKCGIAPQKSGAHPAVRSGSAFNGEKCVA